MSYIQDLMRRRRDQQYLPQDEQSGPYQGPQEDMYNQPDEEQSPDFEQPAQQPYNPYESGVQRAIQSAQQSLQLRQPQMSMPQQMMPQQQMQQPQLSVMDLLNHGATGFSGGIDNHGQRWGESKGHSNWQGLLKGLVGGLTELNRGKQQDEAMQAQMMLRERDFQEKARQSRLKEQMQMQKYEDMKQERELRRQEREENKAVRQAERQESMALRLQERDERQAEREEKAEERREQNLLKNFEKKHKQELEAAAIAKGGLEDLDMVDNALNDTSWTNWGKRLLPSQGDKELESAARSLAKKNTKLGNINPTGGILGIDPSASTDFNKEVLQSERARLQAMVDRGQQINNQQLGQQVEVADPDGNIYLVPASQVNEAIQSGYRLIGG